VCEVRRLTEEEVKEIQAEAASDTDVGDMWRSIMRHAEQEGGDVARVLMRLYGPLWGDPYVRNSAAVAFMLDLPLSEVGRIINETPHSTGAVPARPSHHASPEWWQRFKAAEERMLEQARAEGWTLERVSDAAGQLFDEFRPATAE
jgi:hypothetical protein